MPLNDYEAEQVREVARWKSELPSLLMETYRRLCRPISRLMARVVPEGLVHKALVEVEALAEEHDDIGDILKAAGASSLDELLGRSLEECDRLSATTCTRSEHWALLEGVIPALGGIAVPVVGSFIDVPFLLEATLRAIRRIGHCYGFPLDSDLDRRFVLAVLDIANMDDPSGVDEERLGLWASPGPYAAESNVSEQAEHIEQALIDDLPLESIPFLGDFTNLVLDYSFVRRADITARRVFQERWLRVNGKVESIPPPPGLHRRSSVEGLAQVGSKLIYIGAYGMAFGLTLPASLAGSALAAVAPGPLLRGVRDGASAAERDARDVVEGFRRSIGADGTVKIPSPA